MKFKKAFTLLEILLVIAAMSILATIVIIAINPIRQISQVRDTSRASDINSIQKAIEQYNIDSDGYPDQIYKGSYRPICSVSNTTNCFDPSVLIPTYLSDIPVDPSGNGYLVGIHPENDRISVWADRAELREVVINKFASSSFNLTSGDKDPLFETAIDDGFDGDVNSIMPQGDGKILVGGDFWNYRGMSADYLIRVNSDGSVDPTFNTTGGFDNYVYSVAIQDDGKILVGGEFNNYQNISSNHIIRLNSDGSRDNTFNIGNGFLSLYIDEPFWGEISEVAIYNRALT